MAPHRAKPLLDRLENRVERHSIKLRKKSSAADMSHKQSADVSKPENVHVQCRTSGTYTNVHTHAYIQQAHILVYSHTLLKR
eukprot:30373-Eustigmatos_ZCMA.PRE.1